MDPIFKTKVRKTPDGLIDPAFRTKFVQTLLDKIVLCDQQAAVDEWIRQLTEAWFSLQWYIWVTNLQGETGCGKSEMFIQTAKHMDFYGTAHFILIDGSQYNRDPNDPLDSTRALRASIKRSVEQHIKDRDFDNNWGIHSFVVFDNVHRMRPEDFNNLIGDLDGFRQDIPGCPYVPRVLVVFVSNPDVVTLRSSSTSDQKKNEAEKEKGLKLRAPVSWGLTPEAEARIWQHPIFFVHHSSAFHQANVAEHFVRRSLADLRTLSLEQRAKLAGELVPLARNRVIHLEEHQRQSRAMISEIRTLISPHLPADAREEFDKRPTIYEERKQWAEKLVSATAGTHLTTATVPATGVQPSEMKIVPLARPEATEADLKRLEALVDQAVLTIPRPIKPRKTKDGELIRRYWFRLRALLKHPSVSAELKKGIYRSVQWIEILTRVNKRMEFPFHTEEQLTRAKSTSSNPWCQTTKKLEEVDLMLEESTGTMGKNCFMVPYVAPPPDPKKGSKTTSKKRKTPSSRRRSTKKAKLNDDSNTNAKRSPPRRTPKVEIASESDSESEAEQERPPVEPEAGSNDNEAMIKAIREGLIRYPDANDFDLVMLTEPVRKLVKKYKYFVDQVRRIRMNLREELKLVQVNESNGGLDKQFFKRAAMFASGGKDSFISADDARYADLLNRREFIERRDRPTKAFAPERSLTTATLPALGVRTALQQAAVAAPPPTRPSLPVAPAPAPAPAPVVRSPPRPQFASPSPSPSSRFPVTVRG